MLVFDSMRCSAQTRDGLDAATISAGLRMLVSEIRAQGTDSPLLSFRQFLQHVAPRNEVCAGLYQEVSLAEWSERMGGHASHSVAGHEPREDSPSLSVLVWVRGDGAGGGGGGASNAGGAQGAVTVLQPASKETLTAVRGGNDYARWLASCARIVADTSASMLLLKPLPAIIARAAPSLPPAAGRQSGSEVLTSTSSTPPRQIALGPTPGGFGTPATTGFGASTGAGSGAPVEVAGALGAGSGGAFGAASGSAGGARIRVGDRVTSTKDRSRRGTVSSDDGSSKPYRVVWDDGETSSWLYPHDLEVKSRLNLSMEK